MKIGVVFPQTEIGADPVAVRDYAQAAAWYRKAAEQDIAPAQYNLRVIYLKGRGVSQDYAEAFKWYSKAAEQGHVGAEVLLGTFKAE